MEKIRQQNSKKTQATVFYVNRIGHEYFVHQGATKTGKPKYFASQTRKGALAELPDGFIFGESINGIVTIQRPKPLLVPETDIELTRQKVAEYRHLKHYRVEAKEKAILVYEPMGMGSIDALAEMDPYSMLGDLKTMLGSRFDDALAKTTEDMGITVRELKRADAYAAKDKRERSAMHLLRNIQYDAVMRFTFESTLGVYQVERRCYRGEEDWICLEHGPLDKMLKKYIRHIGKESFFDLA